MFGAAAVELIAAGDFGKMVAFTGQHVGSVPIADAVGRLKPFLPTAIWRGRRAPSGCPSAIESVAVSIDTGAIGYVSGKSGGGPPHSKTLRDTMIP